MSLSKNVQAVVFDMDGTILDTIDDLADSVNHVLRENGYPERTRDEVLRFVGNGIGKLVERALPQGHTLREYETVFAQFTGYYKMHMNDKTRPYEGVVLLMEKLKADGYKLAIVSNKFQDGVDELRRKYYSAVDVAIGERQGLAKKPAPDSVFKALELLGVPPKNAVYVGDSEVDFQTAQNAGIPCISVLWGFRSRKELEACGACEFAETPLQVYDIIKSRG